MFQIIQQTINNINFMSKTCLKQSPVDDAHLKIAKIYIKAP